MKITINQPLGYSHNGKKDQQEDAVWPAFDCVDKNQRCFVLCDGVGGIDHGEVASQNASRVIGEYLSNLLVNKPVLDAEDVNSAVEKAYSYLEGIADNQENANCSMATTLTCVAIHEEGIIAAHMGDSRIYLVRPGSGILYQSADHSLVNALLQSGELTPEEAKTFPRKNVILKAIQVHAEHFEAEVHQLTDIQPGDYLFLCCDGVLENISNELLVEILSKDIPDADKIRLLEQAGEGKTKDNYTAYLIPIADVMGTSTLEHDDIEASVVEVAAEDPEVVAVVEEKKDVPDDIVAGRKKKPLFMSLLIILLLGMVLIWGGRKMQIGERIQDTSADTVTLAPISKQKNDTSKEFSNKEGVHSVDKTMGSKEKHTDGNKKGAIIKKIVNKGKDVE